ncbi:MAG TPA: DNA translocase FtsK, partial [Planctomycetota bacterium]|nr:DNA translocase FtsK [Planctomycetota bacterium]
QGGADKLAGKGDMLFMGAGNSNLIRAKGVYISDDEIRGVVNFCKGQAEPVYSDEIEKVAMSSTGEEGDEPLPETNKQAIELDEKFDEAVEVFLSVGRASTSLLQRRMGLGYTRAAKLCDQMEARGIVGPDRGPKGRELLITQESWDTFKRARAGEAGSAWGPKGSKDNPITTPVAGEALAEDETVKPAAEVNPDLLAKLMPIDGVKEDEEDEA